MDIIVCFKTCWDCKLGYCKEPPAPHPWWDQDDVDHRQFLGLSAPEGNCACPCGRAGKED